MIDNNAITAPDTTSNGRAFYQRVFTTFDRITGWCGKGLLALAAATLVILMVLTLVDVVGRYFLNRPIAESFELTQILLLAITFFGLAYVAMKKSNVRIEVITSHIPDNMKSVISVVVDLMSLAFFVIFAFQAFEQIKIYQASHQIFSNLRFPIYTVRIPLFIGTVVFCLVLLRDVILDLYTLRRISRFRFGLTLALALVFTVAICLMPFWFKYTGLSFSTAQWSIFGVAVFFVLMFMGMTLASGLGLVGFLGVSCMSGLKAGLNLLGQTPASVSMNYTFSIIPLFVLMGMFAYHSKIIADLYHTAGKWVGHVPGGLAVASLAGCAGFAAVCGSSVASAAAMSTICYPELKKYKYDDGLSTGTIVAGGTLGILIPPSMDLIIYGVLTLTSIGALFIAGILPGVLMTVFYMGTALLLCRWKRKLGPPVTEKYTLGDKIRALPRALPVIGLFIVVIGGIYLGIFTPTEGASIGCFGALIIALIRKSLNWKTFYSSLKDTIENSSMLIIILIGAMMFGYFLALTGVPTKMAAFLTQLELNRWVILALIMVVYLVMGCLMDAFSIMIITVPILFPAVMALGFDPIWYGILMITTVEMGLITPPFGMGAFIVAGSTKVSVGTVFRGLAPFLATQILTVILLMIFPSISTFLPSIMNG